MSYSDQELASRAVLWEIGMAEPHVSSDRQSLGHPGNFPVLLMMVKPIPFACFAWETGQYQACPTIIFHLSVLRQDLSLNLALTDSTRSGLSGKPRVLQWAPLPKD